jgi:hypothetical protein
MTFRAEMGRARAELQALKAAIGRASWSTGTMELRIINDPEEGLEEYRLADWDGVSCIEVGPAREREPEAGAAE